MAELLLEIFSEEIPARMQARAAEDLLRLVGEGLAKNGLSFDGAKSFVTPRRLVLVIEGLPAAGPDVSEEKRGPRVGAPEQAMAGFLASTGMSLDQLEQRDTGKGVFYFAVINKKGRPTVDAAKDVIEAALTDFPWPKSQRWGANTVRWVRPLQSLLCLFAGAVVPVSFGPIRAGNVSRGHRFLAPADFTVTDFADYSTKLAAAKVVLDPVERRHAILRQAEEAVAREGFALRADDGLLAEVTGLVEYPNVMVGTIDDKFMAVPQEVLITSMRSHQKYFSLLKADGSLAPRFLVVSNMATNDNGAAITAGNQRVLRARLSDAAFFWDTDRKQTLESRLPKLAERLFYAKLGTMADKVERIATLSRHLTAFVEAAHADDAERAARLAKADLSTEMVGEFPELQGIMGRYYALNDGEKPEVADAIAGHYAPQGPSDAVPTAPLTICAALADKIDSLVGFFAIDEKPTGSKDPFALRRAALGVIRLVVENNLRLPLFTVLQFAHSLYKPGVLAAEPKMVANDLLDFFADRMKVHLKEKGVRHDLVNAVFALGDEDDLVRLLARVDALADFLRSDDGANLLIAYRRATNIVKIEEKKDGASFAGATDAALLREPEERALVEALVPARDALAHALKAENFADAMAALAGLRRPVDAFFDKVTVNADESELRVNRLKLLAEIGAAMGEVADFAKVEG
ncbi:glycine--tRNA ligase subunit beta [Magnetospirillum sulfuroxidans]|uniref:Glycine--tRNA ligase beta subunit n=1 Tax=Magnetospirillum sulfuroxidans TaxID=611300 RepID=A0ABS5IA91_9PROT|nr:glycine--tRNA ligase subunit beta [Magnetospirillum sulfuroxidans]MBR9971339.1 glycine--tRNA ligase subunit beta [Magnetospirillum sulfuroxidans]